MSTKNASKSYLIPLFGKYGNNKFAIVDAPDYHKFSKYKWHLNAGGYVERCKRYVIDGRAYRKHIFLHKEIMQTPHGMRTDHKENNLLDNRKSNLRICTQAQNTRNRSKSLNFNNQYKGVLWHKRQKQWTVKIGINGNRVWIGSFNILRDAIIAYNEAAKKYHGEFAKLNEI